MKDYLNYDGLAVMAHRGGSLEAPEGPLKEGRGGDPLDRRCQRAG